MYILLLLFTDKSQSSDRKVETSQSETSETLPPQVHVTFVYLGYILLIKIYLKQTKN